MPVFYVLLKNINLKEKHKMNKQKINKNLMKIIKIYHFMNLNFDY